MKKPTLEKVINDLKYLDYELQMYCYHKLNGRDEEAQTYLDAYFEFQDAIKQDLKIQLPRVEEANEYEELEGLTIKYNVKEKKECEENIFDDNFENHLLFSN